MSITSFTGVGSHKVCTAITRKEDIICDIMELFEEFNASRLEVPCNNAMFKYEPGVMDYYINKSRLRAIILAKAKAQTPASAPLPSRIVIVNTVGSIPVQLGIGSSAQCKCLLSLSSDKYEESSEVNNWSKYKNMFSKINKWSYIQTTAVMDPLPYIYEHLFREIECDTKCCKGCGALCI
jgi:hypothetical protein